MIPPERVMKTVLEQGLFRDQLVERLTILGWVMLAVAAGTWLVLGRSRKGYQVTSVYWLGCGLGVWLSSPSDRMDSSVGDDVDRGVELRLRLRAGVVPPSSSESCLAGRPGGLPSEPYRPPGG